MKNLFTLTFWVSIIASFSSLAQTPDINVKYFSTNLFNNAPPSTNNGTSFGLIPLSNVTSSTELTIENRGTGTLTISSIDVIGTAASDFTVTNSPSTTLAPNATTTLRITFNPSVADRRNATVSIGSNDPDESPFRINLFGTGIEPEIDVVGNGYSIANGSSTPITNNHTHFGAEFVTGGSIVRTFTIDNNDLAPLNLTGTPTKVAITGTHASDFTLTAAPPSSVARFESTTFQITFNPSGNGVRTALVTIANDDEDENPYTFAIEGVGTAPSSSADYTISTANSTITITDVNGNGETMEVSESSSNVRFFVSGRTYSIDGGPVTPFTTPADISLSNKTGIVVNTAAGNDIITVGAFTSALPSLTINAGVGDDIVNMNGNITFAANANLDLDLQNDDASPGRDVVNIGTNANVVLVGTGSATIKVSQNVFVNAGGGLTTANGNLLVEANQQGTPTSGNFAGVRLNGLNAMFRVTGSGLLTVKGKGGNTGNDTEGIYLMSGGKILGGTNTVTLEGIGGPTSGFRSYGVLSGTPSEMSSTGGNIVINGTGDGTGVNSFGIGLGYNGVYAGGTISAGGQGNITITGRGSLNYTEEGSVGIDMRALVTTAGGNITFNGYGGGSGNARFCTGISIFATVSPGGMGTLTLYGEGGIGTGTSNYGVYVARLITSNGGNISITGKEGGSSTSFGVVVGNTDINGLNGEINTVTNGGDITVIANSVASTTDNQALIRCHPSNKVTFLPLTNGVGVNFVATTDVVGGPIAISDFEFDNIIGEAIYLGDANTGVINVNEAITHAAGNVYLNTGQALNLNQSFGAGTGNIAINAAGGINPKSTTVDLSGNAISFTSGNNLNIAIGGTTVNTEYDQLNIQGAIDLRGLNLVLSGSYVPVAGNTFTIVNNDGTDAIVGMFNGLTQGATIPDFRGSGLNATISYTGGTDNNDVVITVEAPAAPNINIKGNGLTIDNGDTSPRTEDGTDFGNVDIHSTEPVVRTFTIENTGTADLVIPASGITKSGDGDFGIGTVLLPLTIAAGSSATFPVIIDASGNGRRTATISIQSNDSDTSPYTFDVTAVGVSPEINVTGLGQDILSGDTTPSTLDDTDFGSVDVNSGVESHTFTIQNTGGTGGDLYINTGAITIFGTHADDFSISGITLPATVSPGQSVTFVVNFNPSAIGTRTASIRIANNDLGESQYRFDVQGTGITADYTITTSGNNLIITDVTGTGETLDISQSNSDIRFDVTGKTFSLNNGLATNFPADVPLSNAQSIMVNTEGGNDIINVGAFTTQLPSLTINGGTGDDQVNMNGDITFVANANLDLDLQDDDANSGNDILIFSNDANILLSGTGTATLKASQSIYFGSGSSLVTTNGTMLIEANQQSTPTAGNFKGVEVSGTLNTTGGGITIKGKGGNNASNFQTGVRINGPLLATSGNITIEGTGGAGTANDNYGIEVSSTGTVGTGNGGILLTGMGGGSGASQNNEGVRVRGAISSTRNSPSSTSITLLGTGGNTTGSGNNGVSIADGSLFTNSPILITGIAGNSTADDITILSGTINASASSARTITLSGDKVNIGIGAIIGNNATSIVALIQRTDNTPINLGTETVGSLSYTSDEMNRIFANEIFIGNATSGPMTISATIAPANISATCRITLQTQIDLIMSGGGIATLGGNVRLRSPQIYPNFSGADISMGTGILTFDPPGRRVNIVIDGPIANTNYTQLNVIGVINIFATNLSITGSYTPTAGETFTIINNDGTDPIQNGFNNVTEGGIFNNFLGSGLRGKVTYVGGDGNDVVITVLAPDYTIATTDGNVVITDLTGTGETMDISQNSENIRFNVTGKTYRIDGGITTPFPADIALAGKTSITVNTALGDDIINVGAFTALPSLTINGGTGDDQVNMNGDITFVANANLDLDLQNDDPNPGVDVIILNTDANLRLSGTGAITLKSSKNIGTKSGSSLAAVGGNIVIEANQQMTPTVGSFTGIEHRGTISILSGSGGTGTVTLKGKGGNGTDAPQVGVLIAGNVTGLAGSIAIEGTGGISPVNGNVGIHINAPINSKGLITLIGTGNGLGASADNAGVLVSNTITNIPNTIKGIIITGIGANTTGTGNHGISSNSDFTNTNGAITLTGTAGNTASDDLFINSGTFSSSTNPNSSISLVGNKVTIGSAATIGTNLASFVNLLPRTDNTPINLGTETAGSLSYTSDEMNRIFANDLYIGSATTGPITISAPIAPANISATCRITLQSSSDLTISGGGITTLGGNVRFRAENIYPTFSGIDVSVGTTGVLSNGTNSTYVFDINGPAANTGYTQLQVAGKLSLLQTRITLTGNYSPFLGKTFMIINNTGSEPIGDGFIDYAEGQFFNNFLGSGLSAKITYVGGDGNDVVLTVVARPIFTDSPDSQTLCSGNSATFTVASSNAASYKWQARSNSGSSWGNLTNVSPYSNVTTSTLSISDVTGLNNYEYRCVATNDIGSTNSDPATLTVTPLPNATINYSGSPFAQNAAPVSVNRTGTAGGGYTATPTGLTIDDQTGQITPSSSLINNYVVTYTIPASGGCAQFTTTASVEIVATPAPDYTITTTNGHLIVTDMAGNSDNLEMSENGTNIRFLTDVVRTFSLNGGPTTAFPADIPFSGIIDIVVNASNGNDYIFISDFTQLLPSLTVNGDAGNDIVILGNIHFKPDAHLNIDLQNDPGTPGEDEISINALVVLSGSGTAILKASAGVYLANLTTENGDIVIEVNQQAVPLAAATGLLMQDNTVQITGTGALIIKATRGQTDGPAIQTFGSSVLSTNSGNLTIEGYAGTGTGSGNRGIEIKAQISSVNGNIFLKGTGGGSGSSTDNQGIFLNHIAGGIKTTGSGSITLIGTGGNTTGSANEGIYINSPFIESAAGDVSLTGYSNANSTPVAVNNTPVRTLTAGKTIQINADDISYAGTISTTGTTGSVTLKPTTTGRAVTLGINVANTLHLSSAELGAISTYRLNIGDANSGAITNNANQALSTISNSVALTTGGALNLNASSFGIGSANLLINAAGGINPTAAGTDATVGTASFTSGNDLNIVINGTTADTDYRQLNVVGSVNLTGLDLVLTGSHTPVIGQTFVIVKNDGNDAVIGTFNGLPEGTLIANFLGSGQNATITYTGGDGNDVVLTVGNPLPEDFALSGGGISFCQTPLSIAASGSQIGVSYQLKRNNANIGSPIEGTGNPMIFANLTQAGTYTVLATNTVGNTSRMMSTEIIIQTRNAPNAFNLSGGGASCSGTPVNIQLSNSQIGVLYQLKRGSTPVGSSIPGTGNALSFPPQNTAGNYFVTALTQCPELAMNNTVTINSVVTPNTFQLTGGGTSCGTALPVGLSDSQSGVFYQLLRNNNPVGTTVQGTGQPITLGNHLTQGQYTIVATRAGQCPTTMQGSALINLIDPPALFNVIGGGTACPAGVPISLSGSQSGMEYQLKRGNTLVSTQEGDGNSLSFPNQTVAGTYTVEAISEGNCSRTMSATAIVTSAGTLPNQYNMTGGGPLCNTTTLALGLSDSQRNVAYQLQRNTSSGFVNVGTSVQGTGSALALGNHSVIGEYRVVVNSACLTEMASRKSITACNARITADADTFGMSNTFAQVMPNPVSNIMHLKVTEAKGQKVNVNLVDASGRTLLQRAFVPQTNQHQEEFEVSKLANGMYFLKVNTAEKQATLKIIKVE